MPFSLISDQLVEYDASLPGITLPISLKLGKRVVGIAAKVDTGATDCIFSRSVARQLDITPKSDERIRFGTATGGFWTFRHQVTLSILENEFDAAVYFAEDEAFNRSVLGRHGFLDRTVIGLIDYEGRLYLDKYSI